MRFVKRDTKSPEWESDCGRYEVWLQARLRDGSVRYAAAKTGWTTVFDWLCKSGTKEEAIAACVEHSQRLVNII